MTGNIIFKINRHPGAWHRKDWLHSNFEAKRTGLRKTNFGSSTLTYTSWEETGNQCNTNQKTSGRSFIRRVLLFEDICTAGCHVYPAHCLHPFWAGTYNSLVKWEERSAVLCYLPEGEDCSGFTATKLWKERIEKMEEKRPSKENFPEPKSCMFTDTWIFTLQSWCIDTSMCCWWRDQEIAFSSLNWE